MSDLLPRACRITRKTTENRTTVSFALDTELPCVPGQFAMLWLPGMDEKPFSIAWDSPLTFAISRVGPFSDALQGLPEGASVWVRGPFGKGFSLAPARTLLVGGGYGAAPLSFLAADLAERGAPVEVALGARTEADLLYVKRFSAQRVPVHTATEDGTCGTRGRVTDAVAPLLAQGRFQRVCACGPEGMLDAVSALCAGARVPAELSHEAYMRCGIGLCGSCEHGGRLVCMDGPVFPAGAAP